MENYYSIVRFVNNPLSDESIALGLIVLSSDEQRSTGAKVPEAQVMYRMSAAKVSFAKKLNPDCAKMLDFALKQLDGFFQSELKDQSNMTVQFPLRVKHSFLERLASYSNGLLQFSKPRYIDSDTIATAFDEYYGQFIEPQVRISQVREKPIESRLQKRVISNFCEPLKAKIDVNYTLRKQQLPSLFFDFHLEGIGVNGSMYAVKAIDLNGSKQLDTLQKELSEYESVIDRLNLFAKRQKISGKPHYYLVTDPYEGSNKDRRELYNLLSKENMPSFDVVCSDKLPNLVDEFQKKNVRKFSEVVAG